MVYVDYGRVTHAETEVADDVERRVRNLAWTLTGS